MKETAINFFFEHAGFSCDPKKETPEQGRKRYAKALAQAEERARRKGYRFEWAIDNDCDSREFDSTRPFYSLWECIVRDPQGRIVECLGGVDFGRNGEPWGDPYRRVVEAELSQNLD